MLISVLRLNNHKNYIPYRMRTKFYLFSLFGSLPLLLISLLATSCGSGGEDAYVVDDTYLEEGLTVADNSLGEPVWLLNTSTSFAPREYLAPIKGRTYSYMIEDAGGNTINSGDITITHTSDVDGNRCFVYKFRYWNGIAFYQYIHDSVSEPLKQDAILLRGLRKTNLDRYTFDPYAPVTILPTTFHTGERTFHEFQDREFRIYTKFYRTITKDPLDIPAGKFDDCYKVHMEFTNSEESYSKTYWFAAVNGLVKYKDRTDQFWVRQ